MRHSSRGRAFEYAAALGPGTGRFRQQLVVEDERAIYARAELAAGQLLVLGAGLEGEAILDLARREAARPKGAILEGNEAQIARDLASGRFRLKGREPMQRLPETNRRFALSMQDRNGFMRSTNQYICYRRAPSSRSSSTAFPCGARCRSRTALSRPAATPSSFGCLRRRRRASGSSPRPCASFALYGPSGTWEVENVGIAPDVEVELDPAAWRQGHDLQLEKAVEIALAELEKHPLPVHQRPAYPNYHRTPATTP